MTTPVTDLQLHNPRILIIDDEPRIRDACLLVLSDKGFDVAAASNGEEGLQMIKEKHYDIVLVDLMMPTISGFDVLSEVRNHHPDTVVIVITGYATLEHSIEAMKKGAFDFILKPQSKNQTEGKKEMRAVLEPILKAFARSKISSSLLARSGRIVPAAAPAQRTPAVRSLTGAQSHSQPAAARPVATRRGKSEIVTIGISTGGPNALNQMLPRLPKDLGVPVLIVQHMPPVFTKSLAASLDKKCLLLVKEAENGENILPNVVYIAPGGKQMKLVAGTDGLNRRIKITDDPPENSCKPSADYLFRSVGDYYVGRTTAVIMTGMGSDGTKGLAVLKDKAAYIIGQDESSCIVYGMPKAPAELGYLDVVVPLGKIADEIVKSVK